MSAALVKELRERTGLGLLECKKALAAAGGDIEVAIEELRKSSGMKPQRKHAEQPPMVLWQFVSPQTANQCHW